MERTGVTTGNGGPLKEWTRVPWSSPRSTRLAPGGRRSVAASWDTPRSTASTWGWCARQGKLRSEVIVTAEVIAGRMGNLKEEPRTSGVTAVRDTWKRLAATPGVVIVIAVLASVTLLAAAILAEITEQWCRLPHEQ